MSTTEWNTGLKAGTAGGTLLVLLCNLGHDILRTAVLSAVGVIVSFTISWLLNRLFQHLNK